MRTKIYRPLKGITIITTPDARGRLCIGVTLFQHTHIFSTPKILDTIAYHWRYRWRYSPFPIYWDRYSRDCDQFAVSWCERHPNGWTAYKAYCDALDNAEGPEHFGIITKRMYNQNKDWRHTRDHAAEQAGY